VRSVAPKVVADAGIGKISSIVDLAIVSSLAIGRTSALFFANLLFQLPFALIAQSINTVALKEFSEGLAIRDQQKCRNLAVHGINWNLFLLLPCTALMIVLARPLVRLLFEYGSFTPEATGVVAIALACYAVGLVGWGLQGLTGRFYAARLEMGVATTMNAGAVVMNVILSLSFVAAGMGVAGIALGTSLAFLTSGVARCWHLGRRMNREGAGYHWHDVARSFRTAMLGSLAAALTAFLALRAIDGFAGLPEPLSRCVVLAVPAVSGALAYVAAAWSLGSPEMRLIADRVLAQIPRPESRDGDARPPVNVHCLRPAALLREAQARSEQVRSANLARRVQDLLRRED